MGIGGEGCGISKGWVAAVRTYCILLAFGGLPLAFLMWSITKVKGELSRAQQIVGALLAIFWAATFCMVIVSGAP